MKPSFVLFILFFFILSLSSADSFAQSTVSNPLSRVEFIQADEDYAFFTVTVSSATPLSVLRIVSSEGAMLYEEKLPASNITKRFKIAIRDIDKLHFDIIEKRKVNRETFTIHHIMKEMVQVARS